MSRSAAARARGLAWWLVAVAFGCDARSRAADAERAGAVTPLVAGAPGDAAVDAVAPRVARNAVAVRLVLEPVGRARDLDALARALEARAAAFDAVAPRAAVHGGRVVLSYQLALGALGPMVRDAVTRRGELGIYAVPGGCDPFVHASLARGMTHEYQPARWPDVSADSYVLEAADPQRGSAPLAPLEALVASRPAPRGDVVLLGAVARRGSRDVARRTYCVSQRGAIRAPRVADVRATLDPRTLRPLLRVRLGGSDALQLRALTTRTMRRAVIVAIDRVVVAEARVDSVAMDGWLQIAPAAPLTSTSPEVLAAILRGGPLPDAVRVVETPADDARSRNAAPPAVERAVAPDAR